MVLTLLILIFVWLGPGALRVASKQKSQLAHIENQHLSCVVYPVYPMFGFASISRCVESSMQVSSISRSFCIVFIICSPYFVYIDIFYVMCMLYAAYILNTCWCCFYIYDMMSYVHEHAYL